VGDDFVVAELDLLAKLGPRFPGSESHERLVAHVAAQWAQLGGEHRRIVGIQTFFAQFAAFDVVQVTCDRLRNCAASDYSRWLPVIRKVGHRWSSTDRLSAGRLPPVGAGW
jgi:hypothetical protein